VVEVRLDLSGVPVTIADTAGLRETADEIEAEGVRRALGRAAEADLRIVLLDALQWPNRDPMSVSLAGERTVIAVNKCDLVPIGDESLNGHRVHRISALTGSGIDGLVATISKSVADWAVTGAAPVLTRARHRHSLEECCKALKRFESAASIELAAEDLRLATRAMGRITGRVEVEDMLDVIFREFCIGK
jgi:tRNA modification GTPase